MTDSNFPFMDYATLDWDLRIKHIAGNILTSETKEAYLWVVQSFIKNGFHIPKVVHIDREKLLYDALTRFFI